jgi:hypothetical protein
VTIDSPRFGSDKEKFFLIEQRENQTMKMPRRSYLPAFFSRSDPILLAVALSSVVVIAFVAFVILTAPPPEPFSEISILTMDETTGRLVAANYPSRVVQNESLAVFVRIQNFENLPTVYQVKLKICEPSLALNGTEGANSPTLGNWTRALPDRGEWILNNATSPLTVSFYQIPTGMTRVLFELWKLEPHSGEFAFSQLSVYFHVNVTLLFLVAC